MKRNISLTFTLSIVGVICAWAAEPLAVSGWKSPDERYEVVSVESTTMKRDSEPFPLKFVSYCLLDRETHKVVGNVAQVAAQGGLGYSPKAIWSSDSSLLAFSYEDRRGNDVLSVLRIRNAKVREIEADLDSIGDAAFEFAEKRSGFDLDKYQKLRAKMTFEDLSWDGNVLKGVADFLYLNSAGDSVEVRVPGQFDLGKTELRFKATAPMNLK